MSRTRRSKPTKERQNIELYSRRPHSYNQPPDAWATRRTRRAERQRGKRQTREETD